MRAVTHVNDEGRITSAEAITAIRQTLNERKNTEVLITIMPAMDIRRTFDILPEQDLFDRVKHLDALASTHVDHTDINAVLDLLNELSAWLPEAGKCQASAKFYLLVAVDAVMSAIPDDIKVLSISERKRWVSARIAEWEAMFERAERLCAAITHRCDHLRTFVSYEKEQAKAAISAI